MFQSTLAPPRSQVLFSNLATSSIEVVADPLTAGGLVTRRLVVFGSLGSLLVALAAIFYETRGNAPPPSLSPLPDPLAARVAVEKSLANWRDSMATEMTPSKSEALVFVDQQRRPGQRLRAFAVLGDFDLETCRCFKVRLDLDEPEESILATYYVFGHDPMWVYRAEDFDMIMHWEHQMAETPPSAGAAGDSEGTGPG